MNTNEKIAELRERGFCVLHNALPAAAIHACREAFERRMHAYLEAHADEPNRGPHRHFMPMPFTPPVFDPRFFFDAEVLSIVQAVMDDRVVADQWGCDAPVPGSDYQMPHVDYQRPLFAEAPDLLLPPYMLLVSFGLVRITEANGPIEIAPGSHRMAWPQTIQAVQNSERNLLPVPLEIGDVLVRHPWALHRGTPNASSAPRPLASIRYVRRWYADASREVEVIPRSVWESLTTEQKNMLRFPVGD